MAEANSSDVPAYDVNWEDPLPHALSPTKHYLSRLRKGTTKAIVIFMHGRDDNIDDMVDVFTPILIQRYGGVEGQVKNDGEYDKDTGKECKVGVIGIEARDHSWYPESHNAMEPFQVENNGPYQYSALHKIRVTMLDACLQTGLQPKNVIFVGFSQGANLGNTYLLAGMKELLDDKKESSVPIPGHVLALAGSLFKSTPDFPKRRYASSDHERESAQEEQRMSTALSSLQQTQKVINRLICGTGDRFFSEDEITEAAGTLGECSQRVKDRVDVQVSVGMDAKAPHMITPRMIAAVIDAIDHVLTGEGSDLKGEESASR